MKQHNTCILCLQKNNYADKAKTVIKGMQAFLGDRPFFAGESVRYLASY